MPKRPIARETKQAQAVFSKNGGHPPTNQPTGQPGETISERRGRDYRVRTRPQ